jgi:ATP-dependent Clp protease adapter protein ClpS
VITSPKDRRFASAVRGYRDDTKVYRVMTRNDDAGADECVVQFLSRTDADRKAQAISVPGNTAWVEERYR